jgi:endonuclease-3
MQPREKAVWLADRLLAHYGPPDVRRPDPVESLVTTILSQNTNDANRDRAYASLLDRFGSLDAVRTARVDAIGRAIRVGGLHRQKSARIRRLLNRIHRERGALDLAFLDAWDLDAAMDWLLASPGVGRKTAGIVMLFSFGKPYFPVDTHIRRVLTRVGLIEPKGDPHEQVNELLPRDPALMSTLHLLIIRLGREICRPRRPDCPSCPIRPECDWASRNPRPEPIEEEEPE